MKNKFLNIVLFVAILNCGQVLGQSESTKDSLDTQLVKVVKPYTPKISDAFKIKQSPSLDHRENSTKRPVDYTIFSVPVASVFTPSKSKSVALEQLKREKKFSNIASLSGGNYTTIQGDLFLNTSISKGKDFAAYLSHHSSQGGIKDLFLDDNFSTNSAQLKYEVSNRNMNWNVRAGAQRFVSNWYGLFPVFDTNQQQSFDAKQMVSVYETKGGLDINEGVLESVDAKFYLLSDDFESKEMRGQLDSKLNLELFDSPIETSVGLDFLKGSFVQNLTQENSVKYGNLLASISPKYNLNLSDFNLSIGLKTVYFNDLERSKQKFYFYPKIEASIAVVNSILIFYGGVDGDLFQNTYRNLYTENTFVSPTLEIKPTSMPYNLFLGARGKLTNSLSYDVNGAFLQQNDAQFFQKNSHRSTFNSMAYANGNSFGVVYDNLQTISFKGSLNFELNDKFNFSGTAIFNSYNLDTQDKAWNLPQIESTLTMRYYPTDRLYFSVQGFFTGDRFDLQKIESSSIANLYLNKITNLEAFFDLNIDASYVINNRWSATLKLNNILGQNYHRWMHFPVQGFQISAGAFYKFDL
jgi:hypothetical protein